MLEDSWYTLEAVIHAAMRLNTKVICMHVIIQMAPLQSKVVAVERFLYSKLLQNLACSQAQYALYQLLNN